MGMKYPGSRTLIYSILSVFIIAVGFIVGVHWIWSTRLLEIESENEVTYINFDTNNTHYDPETKSIQPNKLPPIRRDYLIDAEVETGFDFNSTQCIVEKWNRIRTDSIPMENMHKEYMKRKLGQNSVLYGTTPGLFAAFAFPDQIIVTLTTENLFGKSVYCRYYDCHRKELLDQFESFVYPESTVFCPRRVGAEYISISKTLEEEVEDSIPIIPRLGKPQHYFTLCLAPLYGDEPKFLAIADFIEYHKLHGATFFHVYIRNISDYDRILLDDYVRTGDIEVIKLHDHYWREDWLWHNPEINDCHHRSKYFSKWTAFIDLDERIEMSSDSLRSTVDFLGRLTDPNIINLHFRVQWVIKDQDLPARYISDEQIKSEMIFEKYRNSSQIGSHWNHAKCIVRPERVAAMSIHDPRAHYKGIKWTLVNETIGVVRHYRNVQYRVFPDALAHMMELAPFEIQEIAEWIKKPLAKAILDRIKWVYDTKNVPCDMKKYVYWIYGIPYTCK